MSFTSSSDVYNKCFNLEQSYQNHYLGIFSPSGGAGNLGRYCEWFEGMGGTFSGTAGVATALTDADAGAIAHGGDVYPASKHLIGWSDSIALISQSEGIMFLVDYLLYYPSCVVTGTPTALDNTVTLPRYTGGEGVMAAVIVHTALGAAAPTLTLTYTDSGDNSGTSTVTALTTSMAKQQVMHSSFVIPLASGKDKGVKSIDSYTIDSGGTTGTVCFLLFKIIGTTHAGLNTFYEKSCIIPPTMPNVIDGACLGFMNLCIGALQPTSRVSGTLIFGWD